MLTTWVVMPTCLPLVRRRCHACASDRFRPNGKFRVNAHHKRLDVWLLALCTRCGATADLTVMERAGVRTLRPAVLDRPHANDPALAAELLQDPSVRRRNRIALDWTGAWRLETDGPGRSALSGRPVLSGRPAPAVSGRPDPSGPGDGLLDVTVRFAAPVPVRPSRLIAAGSGLSRARVERLHEDGRLVAAVRMDAPASADFTFLLKC